METSFVDDEDNKGFESNGDREESCGEEDVVLQVGAGKNKGQLCDDEINKAAASSNLKNFMNCSSKQGLATTKLERSSPESESRSSSSAKRQQMDDRLGSSKAELDEVMEENQRLKMYLDRILKDYRTLQMQYQDIIIQQGLAARKQSPNSSLNHDYDDHIALSLGGGRSSPSDRTKDEQYCKTPIIRNDAVNDEGGDYNKEGLTLGLDCKFQVPIKKKLSVQLSPNRHSPENTTSLVEEAKVVDEGGETAWPPKTTTMKNNVRDTGGDNDEITQQNPAKRARVSVRVRCDTPTMNDGCQWRKYGQKIAKGNPCPRAYYRCTVAPSCPVRKQVQRCAEDMSILITTYEGTHNHPLPISATAMVSTTSAAVSMLMSGSSTSATGPGGPSYTTAATGNLNGLNFYLSDNSRISKPFYLPNSSISSSPSSPTITLDLTSNSSTSSHLSRLANFPQRYSTTNLNFSSLESNPLPISWTNETLSYGSPQPLNKNQTTSNSLKFGAAQLHDQTLYHSYLQKNITNPSQQNVNHQDTIAAATKAITSDPSFQSALAAALSSIIGSNGATLLPDHQNEGENKPNQINNINSHEPSFPILSSFPSSTTSNASKCAPSFLNKSSSTTSSSHQPGGLMFLSPPFSNTESTKSNSSPGDNRDHAA